MVLFDAIGLYGLIRIAKRTGSKWGAAAWFVLIPALGPVSYTRLDIVVAVILVWTVERALAGRWGHVGLLDRPTTSREVGAGVAVGPCSSSRHVIDDAFSLARSPRASRWRCCPSSMCCRTCSTASSATTLNAASKRRASGARACSRRNGSRTIRSPSSRAIAREAGVAPAMGRSVKTISNGASPGRRCSVRSRWRCGPVSAISGGPRC